MLFVAVLCLLPIVFGRQCSQVPTSQRSECGFPGITRDQCERRNCCWDISTGMNSQIPWCFQRTTSGSWRNEDGSARSSMDRRMFIQGKWDERRRSRGRTIEEPRQMNEQQNTMYKKGVEAWRKRGANIPSTDRRRATSYVPGTWPTMCPSNGMSPDVVSRFLGPGGSGPVSLGSNTHFIVRSRKCTKFSGCGDWTIQSDGKGRMEPLNNDGTPFQKTSIVMQVRGDELFYRVVFNDKMCPHPENSAMYSPKTPYSFANLAYSYVYSDGKLGCPKIGYYFNNNNGAGQQTGSITVAGSIGNNCVSLFSDTISFTQYNVPGTTEFQVAIYGTY